MKTIIKLISKYWYIIIIIFLALIFHTWFFNFGILSRGDWGYYSKELQSIFFSSRGSWIGNVLIGLPNTILTYTPLNVAEQFLHNIFKLNFGVTERLLFFFPMVFSLFFSAYCIVLYLFKSRIAASIAGLVFLFNVNVLASNSIPLFCSFGTAAFSFYFALKFLIGSNKANLVYSLLFLFLSSAYDFRVTYIILFILFLYITYYYFFINKIKKNIFVLLIIYFLVFVMLNLYWLMPALFQNTLTNNRLFDRSLFGNSFFDILKSMTLFFYTWTGSQPTDFKVQSIPLFFFAIPIFAFLGLILNRKNKNIIFFGIIALLGIFLSKQSGNPFPNAYLWLYNNFPGFNAFREASKFYFLIALGYSVIIGSFIDWIWRNWNKNKWQTLGKYTLTFLIAGLFLWNTKPIITGEIGLLYIPRHIPGDYLVFKDFVLKQPEYFRTFWTPTDSRWGIYVNNKPKISNVNVIESEWGKNVSLNPGYNNLPENKKITEIFKIKGANELFDISSIKYIIVPIRDFTNDDDFFIYYGGSENANIREWYISELDKVEWLKKIDIGTKDLVTYENENFRPHIYMTKEQETIYQELPYKKVDFEQKNPSEYKIHLKNISSSFYLNFSESYHPDWGVKIGNFNWFSAILEKNYFLKGENHIKNNAGLNSFYIDLSSISSNNNCTKNEDGSYNVDLTLYFKPQSYFYLGLIISGITLIGITGYLVYDFKKRRKLQNKEIKKNEKIL